MTIVAIVALILAVVSLGMNSVFFVVSRRRSVHGKRAEKKAIALLWQLKERINDLPTHEELRQCKKEVRQVVNSSLRDFEKGVVSFARRKIKIERQKVDLLLESMEAQVREVIEIQPETAAAGNFFMAFLDRMFHREPRGGRKKTGKESTEEFPGDARLGLNPS